MPKTKRKTAQPLNHRAIAKRASTNGDHGGEKPPPKPELLGVPVPLMLAAESIVARSPKDVPALHGIMLHAKEGIGRIVATDGTRYFIGQYAAKPMPSWLKSGILVQREGLKQRVSLIAKADSNVAMIAHTKGNGWLHLSDSSMDAMTFKLECGEVKEVWPYEQHIKPQSFAATDDEGEQRVRGEWEPVGFNSKHMKEVGELAAILGQWADKEDKKNGTVIRVFEGGGNAPRVFTFDGWEGAILVVGATVLPTRQLPLLTAKVLEPATKGTLAALRAHASRWLDAAAAADTDEAKAACMAKAESFQQRIAAILQRVPETAPAIAAPAEEKAEQPPADAEPQTAAEKAAATRKKRAAARAAKVLH
jgi:hypothetical protein